jgi:hypothetical protein
MQKKKPRVDPAQQSHNDQGILPRISRMARMELHFPAVIRDIGAIRGQKFLSGFDLPEPFSNQSATDFTDRFAVERDCIGSN